MRRVAVLSDIHSNREALDAVLAHVDHLGVAEVWCLGDIIGNGHDPVGCLDLVEDRCAVVLAGNHEVVIAGRGELPPAAAYSRRALARAGGGRLDRLAQLPSERQIGTVRLAHGCPSPFDPVRDYLVEDVDPEAVLDACSDATVILVGHTHVPGTWSRGSRQLVAVGSVGEPRGGTLLPTWTELAWRGPDVVDVVRHHVEFDLGRYRRHMRDAGLALPPMWSAA